MHAWLHLKVQIPHFMPQVLTAGALVVIADAARETPEPWHDIFTDLNKPIVSF
jgi:hypothetical protein